MNNWVSLSSLSFNEHCSSPIVGVEDNPDFKSECTNIYKYPKYRKRIFPHISSNLNAVKTSSTYFYVQIWENTRSKGAFPIYIKGSLIKEYEISANEGIQAVRYIWELNGCVDGGLPIVRLISYTGTTYITWASCLTIHVICLFRQVSKRLSQSSCHSIDPYHTSSTKEFRLRFFSLLSWTTLHAK